MLKNTCVMKNSHPGVKIFSFYGLISSEMWGKPFFGEILKGSSERIFLFVFRRILQVRSWNIRIFFSLELESSISRNLRHFFRVGCFFFEFGKFLFMKYKKVTFPEHKYFWGASVSQSIRKAFFWDNIRIFLGGGSVSWNIRAAEKIYIKFLILGHKKFSRGGFFLFFQLGLKSAPGSSIYYYFINIEKAKILGNTFVEIQLCNFNMDVL